MGKFLRENWLWILLPIVVVVGAIVLAVLLTDGDTAKVDYNIF